MWIQVAKLKDFDVQPAQVLEHQGRKIALVKTGDKFHALDNMCPHRGGPLADGHVEGDKVTCAWHAWSFNLDSGNCLNVPGTAVTVYPTRIEGEWLYADLP